MLKLSFHKVCLEATNTTHLKIYNRTQIIGPQSFVWTRYEAMLDLAMEIVPLPDLAIFIDAG
jgi:hypothetical protein